MRNKKIVAFVLFFLMILTSVPVFGATDTSGHWAEESIEKLEANKIMSGYSDGNFRPNKAITREEFCAVLAKYMGMKDKNTSEFPDVKGRWSESAVGFLTKEKLINGYLDGKFHPLNTITREESAAILYRYVIKKKDVSNIKGKVFDDTSNSFAKDEISKLASMGIINGIGNNLFGGKRNISRAEIATLIVNMDAKMEKPALSGSGKVADNDKKDEDKKGKDQNKDKDKKPTDPGSGSGGTSGGGFIPNPKPVVKVALTPALKLEAEYAKEILKRPESDFRILLNKSDYDQYILLRDKAFASIEAQDGTEADFKDIIGKMQDIRIKYNKAVAESEIVVHGADYAKVAKDSQFDLKAGIWIEGDEKDNASFSFLIAPNQVDTSIPGIKEINYSIIDNNGELPEKNFVRKIEVVNGETADITGLLQAIYLAEDAFLDLNAENDNNFIELAKKVAEIKDKDLSNISISDSKKYMTELNDKVSALKKKAPVDKEKLKEAVVKAEEKIADLTIDGNGKADLKKAVIYAKRVIIKSSSSNEEVKAVTEKIKELSEKLKKDEIPPVILNIKGVEAGSSKISFITELCSSVKITVTNNMTVKEEKELTVADDPMVEIDLAAPLASGDSVKIVSKDRAGNTATEVRTLPMPNLKTEKPEFVDEAEIKDGAKSFKIKSEAGAMITVEEKDDVYLFASKVSPDPNDVSGRTYIVELSKALKENMEISVVAKVTGKEESDKLTIKVAKGSQPPVPPTKTFSASLEEDKEYKKSEGFNILLDIAETPEADAVSLFEVEKGVEREIEKFPMNYTVTGKTIEVTRNAVKNKEGTRTLRVKINGYAGYADVSVRYPAPDTAEPQFVDKASIKPGVSKIVVTAEAGCTLQVKKDDNDLGAEVSVTESPSGIYTITFKTPLDLGDKIEIYAKAPGKGKSYPATVIVE